MMALIRLSISSRVALLMEGVDRNSFSKLLKVDFTGRPPHGGRG